MPAVEFRSRSRISVKISAVSKFVQVTGKNVANVVCFIGISRLKRQIDFRLKNLPIVIQFKVKSKIHRNRQETFDKMTTYVLYRTVGFLLKT